MTDVEKDTEKHRRSSMHESPLVLAVPDAEFERETLDRLGRLEAKIDMLVGNTQPGRVKLLEDRVSSLERNDIRRGVYDRLVSAAVASVVSAAIALHDHLGLK
jgi:hypothetical protein